MIQQYLQHEHYALWEVIKFRDSYVAPQNNAATGSASEGTITKKGRIVAVTTEDMQKRRNDVKVRNTLLLALPDEHQSRFKKYKTAQELWAAILKTFGMNEATKKTKKNLLKQQYGNFKVEGSETLEQTFNRLQVIVSQLEFIDIEIEQDDLNQKFLTSLAPVWLMHIIVWRNRSDLDTLSLDYLYNHLKVYEPEVQKKSELNYHNMAFISSTKNSSGNGEVNTASIPTASTQVSPAGPNVATASISLDTACAYIASQSNGSHIKYEDINQIDEDDIEEMDIKDGFDKSKVECFNCHKMGHFSRECRAARSQERGWDWSFMANEEENHDLVADKEAPTEFALMAKSSSDNEVFDNSLCSKACKKNTDSLNSKITEISDKLCDSNTMLYHHKLGLSQVEARLVEFKSHEIKLCEKIRGLELDLSNKKFKIECLTNELEQAKKEKGLPEFADDTITDYSRPSPAIESNSDDLQNRNPSVIKTGASSSTILSKPAINFVKSADRPTETKTDKVETAKKPIVKYAELYRKTSKSTNVIREKLLRPQLVRFRSLNRTQLTKGNSQNNIDDKGYWDSGCSRHMTGNISNLFYYEPFDGGYVSFGQGGCKITGKGTIKTECIVLGQNFKLIDDTNVLLRAPRQHNMYSIDLNNVVPHKDLTCLVAKASVDECMLWHRRLGHLNIKTMNRLVRHNLVRGLPSKCFDNDHTYVSCLKGKQHKAFCKTKLVNLVSKPLHTLHIDLFGPTSVSSLNYKWYCLVVIDDFSRFTWTFFLKTKNETSGILRNFITKIENLKDLKVKIIRCDNGGEFRNKEMNDLCSRKGIKREFSNARTPQRNEVLVNKSQNKTPYELFNGRTPAIGFLKPFGCHVVILNTLDHLGKFEAKGDEGTKEAAGQDVKKDVFSLRYIALPNWFHEAHLESSTSNAQDACNVDAPESNGNSNPTATSTNPSDDHMETLAVETLIPIVSSPVSTACLNNSPELSSDTRLISKRVTSQDDMPSLDNILTLTNRGTIDQTLFIRRQRGDFILVQVYVDDIIFGSSNPQLYREFEALMHEKLQMSAMGELNFFLGLPVLQKKDDIFLSQDKYVGDILKKFGYSDVRLANTHIGKENPWGNTELTIVATSTTEEEYVAAASACGQVLWI
nr:hypothetical protein [Tanacetum cinerariifolium]